MALGVAVAGVAVTGESHVHGAFTDEWNQTEPVRKELVVEDRGVALNFDKVDCDGGYFSNHHPAKGVGDGGVRVLQLELHVVILHFSNSNCREALVG